MGFQRFFCKLVLRMRSVFLRRRVEAELDDEFGFHIERQFEKNIAEGMPAQEARAAAMRQFSGIEQRKEECRDTRGVDFVDHLRRDVHYALRGLLRRPGFACAAVLTLAIGIGANAAVFTMVNSVLLRQLPFRNAQRLVWIWSTRTDRDKAFYSIQNFIDTRDQSATLAGMAAFANWGVNLTGSGTAERLQGVRVSANAFEMLGVDAAVGRLLQPSDGVPQASRVVVISNGLWRRRLGGDERVLGQSLLLNGLAYTVVGVLPAEFTMPNAEVDVASPLVFESDPQRSDRGSNFLRTLALLKPGVTPKQVQDELTAITDRLKQQYPVDNAKHTAPRVLTLRDEVIGGYGALLWTLLGAVGIVLFTACTNLANMLLVRSAARQKDFAIRSALGGSRSQLTRELMTAGLLIAGTGGALGLALARWGVRLLVAIGPADLPRAREIALDWHVFAFTCCISLIVGVVFGLTPALQANRIDINHTLKAGGRSDGEDASGRRLRRILVVSEVALSLLLLVGAGLLIRSFVKLQSISVGADTRNVLSVRVSLPAPKYAQSETMNAFVNALVESIQKLPGVDSASVASILPLSGMNTRADFIVAGHPPATEAERPAAQNRWVAPDYFRTMRIPILRGREFGPFDTSRSQPVAVIDAALAERYFRDENPLGQHLEVTDSGPSARTVEIIGVVGNVKHFSLDDSPIPTYYSPLAQVAQPALGFLINGVSLVARTGQNPRANAELVRREIQLLDPNVPASAVQTMEQLLAASVAARRFNLLLIDVFAVMALLLAAMGIYSVVSCTVAQRRREIGIRMALGASSRNVFREILREGMQLTAIGTALGLIAALLSTRFLAGLLFAVTPTDPLTFATITAMIAATSFLACFIPARRATSVDATTALRSE